MSSSFTRRNMLRLMSSAPLLGMPISALAQAPTPIKFVGAAAVARPDQGFMFVGMTTGFYKDLGSTAIFSRPPARAPSSSSSPPIKLSSAIAACRS